MSYEQTELAATHLFDEQSGRDWACAVSGEVRGAVLGAVAAGRGDGLLAPALAATGTEIVARCYPIETVSKFELKASESEGWVEQAGVEYLIRQGCVISLSAPLLAATALSALAGWLARVTYTGGYVMPGTVPGAGQTALPADLETAAVEQVAVWYQQRDKLGLVRHWPSSGTYLVFSQLPLLPQVSAMIRPYRRWSV